MRKKSVLNLDPRLSAMVDNAFYCTNPPPSSSVLSQMGQQERLPVMLAYIQHLVTRELNKTNVDKDSHYRVTIERSIHCLKFFEGHHYFSIRD